MSGDPIDPRAILARLEEVRAETLRRFASLTQEELDWRPGTKRADTGADEWSLGEIFMHIAIDEHHLRENIARPLLEGVKPPESIEFLPPPPPHGLPKEAILFWFERTRLLTRRLLENWPATANLALRHGGGFDETKNGAEWLLSYSGHEAFHHRQIDAVIQLYNQRALMSAEGYLMQFLYRLTPVRIEMVTVGPTPEEQAIVSEHSAHLAALTEQGVMLLVGRTQDNSPRTFGIVVFQAESEEQAQAIMHSDPAVQKGVMRAELFPFRVALAGNVQSM